MRASGFKGMRRGGHWPHDLGVSLRGPPSRGFRRSARLEAQPGSRSLMLRVSGLLGLWGFSFFLFRVRVLVFRVEGFLSVHAGRVLSDIQSLLTLAG